MRIYRELRGNWVILRKMKGASIVMITLLLPAALAAFTSPTHLPSGTVGRKAIALIFVLHDCPIANSYAPELERIIKKYTPHKIDFFLVYPDARLDVKTAKAHAKQFGYTCSILLDPKQLLVKKTGATITPEVAVVTPNGLLLYRGRIDDTYVALGKRRFAPTSHDLRTALDKIINVTIAKITPKFTKAVGCFIPFVNNPKTESKPR